MSNNEKPNRPWVPIQILAASLLFGPGAAGAVTGINFNRLGKPKYLLPCIITGTVLFLLEALALVFVVPDDLLGPVGFLVNLLIGLGFMFAQKSDFETWKSTNWKPATEKEKYKPTHIGLLFLVAVSALLVEAGIIFLVANPPSVHHRPRNRGKRVKIEIPHHELITFEGHTNGLLSVCFSPDGKYAISGDEIDNILVLWDIESGSEIKSFKGHTGTIHSVDFSPDGKYALSGSWDKSLKLWDIASGKEIKSFEGHYSMVTSVDFSPDGKYAISGSSDNSLKLWDIASGTITTSRIGHSAMISSVKFSPDGKYAISGSGDNTIKLWDMGSVKNIRIFQGHTDYVTAVDFSPDGKFILSGSNDNTIKLWDITSGKEVSNEEQIEF